MNATLAIRVFDLTAKTGYPMIEKIQGQRSNPRGVCAEDLEASSPAINKRLLSLTRRHLGVFAKIKKGETKEVGGNEEDLLFWDDIWLDEIALKHRYPRLYALELSKHISVSNKLSNKSLVFSYRRNPRGGIEEDQQRSLQSSLDKLLTLLNLSLRGVDIPFILCPLCNISVESISDLLFSCSLARQLRTKFLCWWELEDIDLESYEDWLQWFNNVHLSKRIKEMFEGANYVMWCLIWRFRNLAIFGDNHPCRELLFEDLVHISFIWCSSRSQSKFNWVT
ncbi:hypothetical protein Tco_1310578 [Tanacetum coccineum]